MSDKEVQKQKAVLNNPKASEDAKGQAEDMLEQLEEEATGKDAERVTQGKERSVISIQSLVSAQHP